MDYFAHECCLALYVKDFEKSRRFYQDYLGLKLIYDWDDKNGDKGMKFQAGDGMLEIMSRQAPCPQGATTVLLEAKNAEACYNQLKDIPELVFDEHLTTRSYGKVVFRLADPDGNILSIFHYTQERKANYI